MAEKPVLPLTSISNENETEMKFSDRVKQKPYTVRSIHLDHLAKLLPVSQHTNGLTDKRAVKLLNFDKHC